MYVVVRRYTGASALADAMVRREQEVRELISTVPGFRAYYAARTGGGDAVATVTVCDDKAGTDESTRRAGEWVRANVSGASIPPPEITEGETYISF
jgi:heme-degrading monooxygenase HmoA